jgi:hypothetical protein
MNRRLLALALLAASLAAVPAARADWPAGGLAVGVATGTQTAPDAVGDGVAPSAGGSGVFVVWEDARAGSADIWCLRLTRAGAPAPGWPASGIAICTAAFNQIQPHVCLDGASGVFVAWTDQTSGAPQSDIYMQHVTGDGAIAAGWPATTSRGLVVCNATGRQTGPALLPDGAGGVYVTWTDGRTGTGLLDAGLAHLRADGSRVTGWPSNGFDMFFDGLSQMGPGIAGDGATPAGAGAGCFIAFYDRRNYVSDPSFGSDVFLMRYAGDGFVLPGFSPAGNDLTADTGDQTKPILVADGAGGVLVAWMDARLSIDGDLSVTRIDGDGEVHPGYSLLAHGLALTTAPGAQDGQLAVTDGAAGAIVVWRDAGTGPDSRLRATRATGDGAIAPGWPTAAAGGFAICSIASDQQQHAIVSDGAAPAGGGPGVIVAWRDGRNASTDIYATRVTGGGAVAPGWPAEGVGVCMVAGAQSSPVIASDGAGGAFVFWYDQRSDGGDVYGAHLTANGDPAPVAGVGTATAARFALRAASANPAHGGVALSLSLPARADVSVEVFDPAGRRVRTLLAGEPLEAGTRALVWDGRDDAGRALGAGLYFVAARAGGERSVVRVARAE